MMNLLLKKEETIQSETIKEFKEFSDFINRVYSLEREREEVKEEEKAETEDYSRNNLLNGEVQELELDKFIEYKTLLERGYVEPPLLESKTETEELPPTGEEQKGSDDSKSQTQAEEEKGTDATPPETQAEEEKGTDDTTPEDFSFLEDFMKDDMKNLVEQI